MGPAAMALGRDQGNVWGCLQEARAPSTGRYGTGKEQCSMATKEPIIRPGSERHDREGPSQYRFRR